MNPKQKQLLKKMYLYYGRNIPYSQYDMKSKSMPFAKEYVEVFSLWWITRLNKEYYIHREEEDIDAATAELTEEGIEWLMK